MDTIFVGHQDMFGTLWFIGWMFSIGYLHLTFGKGVLALIIWPYYLGIKIGKHKN